MDMNSILGRTFSGFMLRVALVVLVGIAYGQINHSQALQIGHVNNVLDSINANMAASE